MKKIVDRKEYAQAIGFGDHQVILVDLNQKGFMDTIFEGSKVRVDFGTFRTGERHLAKGTLCYNKKDNEFYISSEAIMITKDFTYQDAIESAQFANAPIINDGDEVVIVLHNSEERFAIAYLAKAKKGDRNCTTIMSFE